MNDTPYQYRLQDGPQLIFFLRYGFVDYSYEIPPVSALSAPALQSIDAFEEKISEEEASGFLPASQSTPFTVSFRVPPGLLVKKTSGGHRLVNSATHPRPESHDGVLALANGTRLDVSANKNTNLPDHLNIQCPCVESLVESIAILATAASQTKQVVVGRTWDYSTWFRQLAGCQAESWKVQWFTRGGYRPDKRVQMGRASAAHNGQRLSLLIAEIIERTAEEEDWAGLQHDHTPNRMNARLSSTSGAAIVAHCTQMIRAKLGWF